MRRGSFQNSILWIGVLVSGFSAGQKECVGEDRISEGTRGADGVMVHEVNSAYQSGETTIRVLLPDRVEKERRYAVLYVLPVEAGDGQRWGDSVAEFKRSDVANRYDLICVFPTFSDLPWYADHPTDLRIRQESYFLKVVMPFVERTYPALRESGGRLLIGFSKSGWGAWSLLLRHPDVFGRAAAFDAPMMMEGLVKYGTEGIFGTEANFQRYRVTTLLAERAASLQNGCRLVLVGQGNFQREHEQVHGAMDRLGISHVYRVGPMREHKWEGGWVAEAVELLVGGKTRRTRGRR